MYRFPLVFFKVQIRKTFQKGEKKQSGKNGGKESIQSGSANWSCFFFQTFSKNGGLTRDPKLYKGDLQQSRMNLAQFSIYLAVMVSSAGSLFGDVFWNSGGSTHWVVRHDFPGPPGGNPWWTLLKVVCLGRHNWKLLRRPTGVSKILSPCRHFLGIWGRDVKFSFFSLSFFLGNLD